MHTSPSLLLFLLLLLMCLQCYKAVPVLMDKQLRKAQGGERMNIMYAVSKLLRLAKKELKNKSKYGEYAGMSGHERGRGGG